MSIDFINYLTSIYQTNFKQNPIKMIRNRLYRDKKMAFEHGEQPKFNDKLLSNVNQTNIAL